ncbi:calsyntenin-1-like [Pteropus vampyrus]|uniref:Calsyntenin-1-like n=1 Tax=Pteropus vampyrus TaxID=132908 RepID=A0A6P3RP99_PTEVA|nr:calsyntenin-1-like [Pteropus vampyrus]
MTFTGVDTMASYEEVLHLLRYRNWHSRSLLDRKFKLVCSELNGRYISNEFQVEVNVIHTASPVEHASHMAAQPQFVHPDSGDEVKFPALPSHDWFFWQKSPS